MSASFTCNGRLFHSPGPAAPNVLSPKVLYVRVTTHVRLAVESRRRSRASATRQFQYGWFQYVEHIDDDKVVKHCMIKTDVTKHVSETVSRRIRKVLAGQKWMHGLATSGSENHMAIGSPGK